MPPIWAIEVPALVLPEASVLPLSLSLSPPLLPPHALNAVAMMVRVNMERRCFFIWILSLKCAWWIRCLTDAGARRLAMELRSGTVALPCGKRFCLHEKSPAATESHCQLLL